MNSTAATPTTYTERRLVDYQADLWRETLWTFAVTGSDLLTVTRNGEKKTVRVVHDSGFVVALRKSYIRAANGAEGLHKSMSTWANERFPSCWLEKVLHWAFETCKPAV